MPDYRITCFFADRDYGRQGVARVALNGALELIALAGGEVVESYPQGHSWRQDVDFVSLQRGAEDVRAGGLHLHSEQGQEPFGDAYDGECEAGAIEATMTIESERGSHPWTC